MVLCNGLECEGELSPSSSVASAAVIQQCSRSPPKATVTTKVDLLESNNKRARTMPSVSIYRPPAARKLEQSANLTGLHTRGMVEATSPERSKLQCSEETKELSSDGRRSDVNGTSVFRSAISSIRTQNKVPVCKNNESTNKKSDSLLSNVGKVDDLGKGSAQSKQRRPDIKVASTESDNSITDCNLGTKVSDIQLDGEKVAEVLDVTTVKAVRGSQVLNADSKEEFAEKTERVKREESLVAEVNQSEEFSKNSNSVAEISSLNVEKPSTRSNGVGDNSTYNTAAQNKPAEKSNGKSSGSEVQLNPEECDWESMFDDTGECLDPSLLEQLTTAVGDVTIERPKSAYNDFKMKSLDLTAEEFPHVIEIYNFPPEFQLQDLMTVFSRFKNSGFEIKWVDDTHALGVFSSSAVVSEVLSFNHPFVKTRLLKEGTQLSKMKARRSAEFLQPYKPRPDTCPALARRLVTGALGVKLPTSREEREAEKKLLTKAREKKRLEAKQKEDAWEGTFS
ncbi:hypothetical protein RUM43_007507 [Polyplax serrata]|uniref:Uncharacterized protein n=1 Tax=Polyplax serrata TaxID=468196 RepID=A0AAN8PMS3_POLSC